MKRIFLILSLIGIIASASAGNDVIGRVTINTNNGNIIEFQSGIAPLGTLTQNAINAGYDLKNIQEKYITSTEYQAWLDAQPKSQPIYEEKIVPVASTGLDPITQTAISTAAGGAGAYLVIRRRKP